MLIKSDSNTTNIIPINNQSIKSIAIACALSSKGMNESERSDIFKHHLIKDFMPSFCKTATTGYAYSFYLRWVNAIRMKVGMFMIYTHDTFSNFII